MRTTVRRHHRQRLALPATAYYLRKHAITDGGVLKKFSVGSGAAGRNMTILFHTDDLVSELAAAAMSH